MNREITRKLNGKDVENQNANLDEASFGGRMGEATRVVTKNYLKSYYDEDVDLNHIYRYMDKLYNTQMELAQQISVEHTRKLFGGKIGLMFYDVTTLYFETAQTDVLREPGFSKDGKTAESQVVLGLLVSEGGYPLSYSLSEDGHIVRVSTELGDVLLNPVEGFNLVKNAVVSRYSVRTLCRKFRMCEESEYAETVVERNENYILGCPFLSVKFRF